MIKFFKNFLKTLCCLGYLITPAIAAKPALPPDVEKFSQDFVNLLTAKNFEAAGKLLAPEVNPTDFQNAAQQLSTLLGKDQPFAEFLDWNSFGLHPFVSIGHKPAEAFTDYSVRYQLPSQGKWLLLEIVVRRKPEGNTIYGVHWQESNESIAQLSKFSLSNKSVLQYVILAVAVVVPIFILFTFVLCLCTQMPHKWRWAFFCLFGIGTIVLNWNDGSVRILLLHFQLLGSGVMRSPSSPWMISVSLPLGGILFLRKRSKLRAERLSTTPATTATPLS